MQVITKIFVTFYDTNKLIGNSNLAHICNWLKTNKLNMHPSKSKLKFIGSVLIILAIKFTGKPYTGKREGKACFSVMWRMRNMSNTSQPGPNIILVWPMVNRFILYMETSN